MASRRRFLAWMPMVAALCALAPGRMFARRAQPAAGRPEARLVMVDGWVLRDTDIAGSPHPGGEG